MSEKDIQDLTDAELVNEYESVVSFRAIEQQEGQVSPAEIQLKEALEEEILERMKD
jgi:hypothetical protein